jgi:hypothetical protein
MVHAQELWVQDTSITSDVYLWGDSPIRTLAKLPRDIRRIVDGVLTDRLPPYFTGKVHFREGTVVDLKKYFLHNNAYFHDLGQVTNRWVMPAYRLWFFYVDSAVGIQTYTVELELDEHGQVLGLNLPHKEPSRSRTLSDSVDSRGRHHRSYQPPERGYRILPLRIAVDSARTWAQAAKMRTDTCDVGLKYDHCNDELFWKVAFRQKTVPGETSLNDLWQVYDIKVEDLTLIKSYEEDRGWIM